MDLAVEEGAGGQHHGLGHEADTKLGDGAADLVAFDDQIIAGLGENGQVGLVLEARADGLLVQHAVGLGAGGAHRRTFRGIEDAELDAGFVCGGGHGTAQRIDFTHQMALADAADRRVAAHRPERFEVVRQQQRGRTGPRRGKRGFGTGVAAADDDDIETGGIKHGKMSCCGAVWDRRFYVRQLENHRLKQARQTQHTVRLAVAGLLQ
ncbi:hypothetical protein SDC9_182939 [bioreactor metagenome]|uniref:Uncharacterized protein n=1 Tax=bioreactor metagenome TaxID=1076179 RepID=A0A645H8S5_9ZZZZ